MMNTDSLVFPGSVGVLGAAVLLAGALSFGQDSTAVQTVASTEPATVPAVAPSPIPLVVLPVTEMDQPGQFHENFGLMPGSKLEKSLRRLAKIDMDGDLNYDGSINDNDGTDQGASESVSPGLQLGVGELTKLVIRFKTYENSFPGDLFVKLEVAGINRFAASGKYEASDAELLKELGRIKVWRDMAKTELLIDSGDPEKQQFEWKVDLETLMSGIPGGVPRIVFVEGVEDSKKFEGDLRLLISASHAFTTTEEVRPPSPIYHAAFDHILFTVLPEPIKKEFVNNNAEGVWSR